MDDDDEPNYIPASRDFDRAKVEAPSLSKPRRESPPRYDPEAIGKIIGDAASAGSDSAAEAEEAAWSEVRRYEQRLPGYKSGENRRASDYAHGNDAGSSFEKEWGDMVAVSAAGCGVGAWSCSPRSSKVRAACTVLAFTAAAVAVGVGTFTGVERMYSSGPAAPAAEVSEEGRIQGALPTPTPPVPPSDLADICSIESFSSDPSSERACKDACTKAECCFIDAGTEIISLSCKDEHQDICQEYESYCTALDLEMLGIGARSSSSSANADADEEA